jgi:hypothetical protein
VMDYDILIFLSWDAHMFTAALFKRQLQIDRSGLLQSVSVNLGVVVLVVFLLLFCIEAALEVTAIFGS